MKSWLPVFASLVLVACRTTTDPVPATPAGAESAPAHVDLSPLRGKSMSLEAFVVECQKLSGFNFTYDAATRDALRQTQFELSAAWNAPAAGFPAQFGSLLAPDFRCKPVGPEHLHVLLIERNPDRAPARPSNG